MPRGFGENLQQNETPRRGVCQPVRTLLTKRQVAGRGADPD